jgi:hypothetical protein
MFQSADGAPGLLVSAVLWNIMAFRLAVEEAREPISGADRNTRAFGLAAGETFQATQPLVGTW